MTLPNWLRVLQQSYWAHIAQAAALAGAVAYFTCDPSRQTQSCLEVGVAAFFGALYLSLQHSPGSASFRSDGAPTAAPELKKLADAVIDPRSNMNADQAKEVAQAVIKTDNPAIQNRIVESALANEVKQ